MAQLTYGGIPLLGDEGHQVTSTLKWHPLTPQTNNAHLRKDISEWMPVFPYRQPIGRAINRLFFPTGGSRWALMDCIIDDEQRQEIESLTDWNGTMGIVPQTLIADTVGPRQSTGYVFNVDLLPIAFRRVTSSPNADNPLWMMTLADQRYRWNMTTITGQFSGSTITWDSLLNEISSAIGWQIVASDFDERLLKAHEQAFQGFLPMSAGVLLDTIAASTARRLVVLPSGEARLQTPDEAIIQFDANLDDKARIVGQHQERVTRPRQFSLVLNKGKFQTRCHPLEVFQGTASPEPTWDGEFQFRAFTLHDSDAAGYINTTEIQDLADCLAEEYAKWGDRRANMTLPDVQEWVITGFEDYIALDLGVDRGDHHIVQTRIVSYPENFYPTTVYNGNRLIFNEPNWGRLLDGVQAPNASVSGHNCHYVPVRPSTDCTGVLARDPITHYPIVAPGFPLEEGTVKYFNADSPLCDWFTPDQSPPVPPICYYFDDHFSDPAIDPSWAGDTGDFTVDGVTNLESITSDVTITLNQIHPHPGDPLTDRIIRFEGLQGTQDGDEAIFYLFSDVAVRITIDQNEPCWEISIEKNGTPVGPVEPVREATGGYICYTEDDDGTNATVTVSLTHPQPISGPNILIQNLTEYFQWFEVIQIQRTVAKSPNGNAANEIGFGTGNVLGQISLDRFRVEYIEDPLCTCSVLPDTCNLFGDVFRRVQNIPNGTIAGLGCEWVIENPGFQCTGNLGTDSALLDADAWATVHPSKLFGQASDRFHVQTSVYLDQVGDEFAVTFGSNVEARAWLVDATAFNRTYRIGIFLNGVSQTNELEVVATEGIEIQACYGFDGRTSMIADANDVVQPAQVVAASGFAPDDARVGMKTGDSNSSQPAVVGEFFVSKHRGTDQEECPFCFEPCTGCDSTTFIEDINITVGTITSGIPPAHLPQDDCFGTCNDAGDATYTAVYTGVDFLGYCNWEFNFPEMAGIFQLGTFAGLVFVQAFLTPTIDPADSGQTDPFNPNRCEVTAWYRDQLVAPFDCDNINITLPLYRTNFAVLEGIGCVFPATITITG